MRGDVYYTMDYSDEFKVVFNESTMGLYIKQTDNDNNEFRVKYLDKEDIESLGWAATDYKDSFYIENDKVDASIEVDYETHLCDISVREHGYHKMIRHKNDRNFYGLIKNKSELKKLMKQLSI